MKSDTLITFRPDTKQRKIAVTTDLWGKNSIKISQRPSDLLDKFLKVRVDGLMNRHISQIGLHFVCIH